MTSFALVDAPAAGVVLPGIAPEFTVETYPYPGRTDTAVLHLPVTRTVFDAVVADVVRESRLDRTLTGEVAGGDCTVDPCEVAQTDADEVMLHVYLDGSGDPLDHARAALTVLLSLAQWTSYAHAARVQRRIRLTDPMDWTQQVALLP